MQEYISGLSCTLLPQILIAIQELSKSLLKDFWFGVVSDARIKLKFFNSSLLYNTTS